MRRIHRFLRLPSTSRRLFLKSVPALLAVRVGLWLLPFEKLRGLLAKVGQAKPARVKARYAVSTVAWAVRRAGRYVPAATCLPQALTVQMLLTWEGYQANLRLGVVLEDEGKLNAHAWVECGGKVVIGGSIGLSRYKPLPPLE